MNEDSWRTLYDQTERGRVPERSQLSTLFDAIEHHPQFHPSFWHPLGFVHMRLHALDAKSLRLHFWPAGQRRPQAPLWPIHDHIFDIRSVILVGSVENTQYEVTRTEQSPHRIYEVKYGGGNSTLNQLTATSDFVVSQETLIEEHATGGSYSIARTVFHKSVVPPDKRAATLVVTSNPLPASPRVIGETSAALTIDVTRRPCSPEALRSILAEFQASL